MKCEVCEKDLQGEDFDGWFSEAKTHWMSDHADLMAQMKDKPKEEGEKWMADAKAKFDAIQ